MTHQNFPVQMYSWFRVITLAALALFLASGLASAETVRLQASGTLSSASRTPVPAAIQSVIDIGDQISIDLIVTVDGNAFSAISGTVTRAGETRTITSVNWVTITASYVDFRVDFQDFSMGLGPVGSTSVRSLAFRLPRSPSSQNFESMFVSAASAASPLTNGYVAAQEQVGPGTIEFTYFYLNSSGAWDSQNIYVVDPTPPTATVGELSGPVGGVYTATITLSEDSTDFVASDLALVNGTATMTGSGASYTATVTPTGDGLVSLSVPANVFTDYDGNANTASNTGSVTHDGVSPGITLSTTATSVASGASFAVAITSTEPLVGLEVTDFIVVNGSASGLSGAADSYSIIITSNGQGDVQISLPAGAAEDATGNPSLASNTLILSDTTVGETQALIAGFMASRANNLAAHQRELTGLLPGEGSSVSRLDASVSQGRLDFDYATPTDRLLWLQFSGSRGEAGSAENEYVFGALGATLYRQPNVAAGLLLEFDYQSETDGLAELEGTGWLVGPYAVFRHPEQPLFFEGRLLWGETDNEISPTGTYRDSFETERLLGMIQVSGQWDQGNLRWTPSLRATYISDDQKAYTDSLSVLIPGQKIEMRQFRAGIGFATIDPISAGGGEIGLSGGLHVIGSTLSGSGLGVAAMDHYEAPRGRIDLGLDYAMPGGGNLGFSGFYDGIGAGGYESFGANATFALRF